MVTFDPALPDSANIGDSGHVADHNAIVAALTVLNNGKAETGSGESYLFNVKDYDAVGDDSNDDTAEIQAALDAGAGAVVLIPDGTYKISSALTVATGTTITGTGTIHQVTSGAVGLDVGGNNVTIEGITLQGHNGSAAYGSGEHAIDVTGTSAAAPFTNITIRNVTMTLWGFAGVNLEFVDGLRVEGCTVTDCGYVGVGLLSCANGIVEGNRIDNITPGTDSNMYGVYMSFSSTESATHPCCQDIIVDSNIISGVAWEGIDSHSGLRLTVSNNTVLDCRAGIVLASGTIGAPTGCVVSGNIIDSGDDNVNDEHWAVQIYGILTGSEISVPASATITGNVFRRHGALQLQATRGTIVANNVFDLMAVYAVWIKAGNDQVAITGNTFTDTWNGGGVGTYCIFNSASSHYTNGIIVNNLMARGSKTATGVNYCGAYIHDSATNTAWQMGWNDFALATDYEYLGTWTAAALPTP